MSNLDKANSVAHEWVESMGGLEAIRHDHGSDLSGLMQALDDAGLLMPDLPDKDFAHSHEMAWTRVKNGMVEVIINSGYDSDYEVFTSDEAREYALTILAAADYAEKDKDNE